jgi:Mce-associated membrane protein
MMTNGLETSIPVEQTLASHEPDGKHSESKTTDHADGASASTDRASHDVAIETRQWPSKWLCTKRIVVFGIFPALALILAAGSGYLKWQVDSARQAETARVQSLQAATEATIAILSYHPDNADKELTAARDRLAEPFRDQYTKLITDVVVPGAKQKHISAIATVPAAASISATANEAVVLVFIDQSIVIGTDAPTSTSSTVRVTLNKERGRWLITQFDPV